MSGLGAAALLALAGGCATGPAATPASTRAVDASGNDRSGGSSDAVATAPRRETVRPGPAAATDPQAALQQRAERLWTARLAQDWSTMFEYEDLDVLPPGITEQDYVQWAEQNQPFLWESVEIDQVLVDGPLGWVLVDELVGVRRYPGLPSRPNRRWEKWFILDGRWMPISAEALREGAVPETPAVRDAAAEQRLLARSEAFWDARRERDWSAILELIDPRARDAMPSPEDAAGQDPAVYVSHQIYWAEAIGDRGRVRVRFEYKSSDPSLTRLPPQVSVFNERWIKLDGEWYIDKGGEQTAGETGEQ